MALALPLTLVLTPPRATLLRGGPAEIPAEWWSAPPTSMPTIIIIVLPTKPHPLVYLVGREALHLQYRYTYRQPTSKCFLTVAQAIEEVQTSNNNPEMWWVDLSLHLIMNYPLELRDESLPSLINHCRLHCSKVTIVV